MVTERVILPPSAEAEIPADPTAALRFISAHPEREEVRMAVGSMRSGESWCALRTRTNDSDLEVAHGAELVPGLITAVHATLQLSPSLWALGSSGRDNFGPRSTENS